MKKVEEILAEAYNNKTNSTQYFEGYLSSQPTVF